MFKQLNQKLLAWLIGFSLCAAIHAAAQAQRGGGGGGFGGGGGIGGGGRALGSSSATSRPYYNSGTVGEAMISVDPETRRLIVITDEETGQYVSQVVTNLDRPQPQVLIKVVFLEVMHNNSLDVGIEGGFQRRFGNMNTGTVANAFGLSGLNLPTGTNAPLANVFGQPTQLFGTPPPGAGLYQIMGTDYQATLRAIAQAGKMEVLSRPSILARNNQPATITVGQSVPLVTSVSFNGLTGNPISTIAYTPVGIILRVTPFINSEGLVEMIVSPQISELSDQSVTVSAGVTAPVINMRSADTVVVTPDGQPVIIGGLMQKNKAQSDSKIPILGDIPLLGNLFKHKIRTDSRTELIIFLTPHIVMAPSQLVSLSARERSNAELAPKAFTEKELNQFLDTVPKKDAPLPNDAAPGKNGSKSNKSEK
jgi:general secretion pathway protein D